VEGLLAKGNFFKTAPAPHISYALEKSPPGDQFSSAQCLLGRSRIT